MPSLLSLYRKIFFGRKPGWDEKPLPLIQVRVANADLSAAQLTQYAKVCGFNFDGDTLPPTYLYVLAFRLHAVIFTHNSMTFPLLGMIHLKNSIQSFRTVKAHEKVSLECALTSSELKDAGLEFELVSKVYVGTELVWQASSTYLYRIESAGRRARPPRAGDMSWDNAKVWVLSDDLGRQYAKASGDYNLIHLHPLLSKRFGFERVLAHGMWSKARCLAEVMPIIGARGFSVEVEFKLPVFMPSEVSFAFEENDTGLVFELRDLKGRRPHIQGHVSYLD
ncbi:MaoC/PaaZ C-terminal domain-containing protein [Shewanella sp. SR44-3]|uniref:MaoC family dehydratase n=1 Tax=unclassified Shewanella TaxID=196818 RepID=UPI0015F9652F|nr:MaoC/PaaZ C-terminal domain-containing protein [Shewanella sp. SR44-3]MBB1268242.1 dehydratase [Shewanella sp. SR44-3]